MPVPPLPVEITVKIQPNAECITPLQLGNITYQYPTPFTTDKISEIVVTGAPVGYSRFSAIYGPEPSFSINRSAPVIGPGAQFGSVTFQSSIPMSSIGGDADDSLFNKKGLLNPGASTPEPYPYYASDKFIENVDTPRWGRRDSSVYSPQLDFFPRYNQWFASTIWSTPYDPQSLLAPLYYPIMFLYVDRAAKQVYYREGKVNFTVANFLAPRPTIKLVSGTWSDASTIVNGQFNLSIESISAYFPEGICQFDIFFNGNFVKQILAPSSSLTGYIGTFVPGALGTPFIKVTVKCTLQDDVNITATSNELITTVPSFG